MVPKNRSGKSLKTDKIKIQNECELVNNFEMSHKGLPRNVLVK